MDVAAGAPATGIPAFGPGRMIGMALAYLGQHGEKEPLPGDPGLTPAGRQQASLTGRWLHGRGVDALYSSPMRRARETADCIAAATGLAVRRVTHGGINTELLRNLVDDDALPPHLLAAGIPPCAVTTIDNLAVVTIASTAHLS